jgi:hypothetical protein
VPRRRRRPAGNHRRLHRVDLLAVELSDVADDDRRAILQLLARYPSVVDRQRDEELSTVFASDAVFVVAGRSIHGLADLAELFRLAPVGVQLGGLPRIHLDGSRAVSRQSFFFVDRTDGELRLGWYDDRLAKEGDGWRIKERRCTFATIEELSEQP